MVRKKVAEGEKKTTKPKKSKTALAVALPGAESVDKALVDQAVVNLNKLHRAKGLETARAVAEFAIEFFFAGNVENFHARQGTHLSFKELAKRDDLQVSYQFVWNACAVVDQLRALPSEVADALPMSHHKLLLPIKDSATKQALAKAAVDDGLSKREFEERVKEARAEQRTDSKAGRPPLPAFVKAFGKLKHIADLAQEEEVTEMSFAHYSREDARRLVADLHGHIERLAAVAAQVQVIVGT